jgi:pyruvate formate lyase activating enzyme
MDLLGQMWAVDELVDEVEKDGTYFKKSGGGITVSGGEPTMQAEFVAAFLRACRERRLHTTLDTCGYCRREALQMLLPHLDMVLFDLKEIDPERHKTFTGSSNKEILENLIYLRDYVKRHGTAQEVWVRTPIIPNATARKENIMGIGRFIGQHLGGIVSRWELCAFNNLCRDKYIRLGLTWSFKDCELVARSTMEDLSKVAKESGIPPHIVHWSGSTSIEE